MRSGQPQVPAGGPNPSSPSVPSSQTKLSNQQTAGEKPAWPLSYRLKTPIPKAVASSRRNGSSPPQQGPRQWWHYYRYSNAQGQKPALIYCQTKDQSQRAAELFLGSPVVGFDMEWPWDAHKRTGLKNKVALIQLASQGRIALFHVALHQGTTADDLIAPALRAILESPAISKAYPVFGLEPKGAFELSHLHNLVHYGDAECDLITTKLIGLAKQVEDHLGLPLWKGKARTSDWSKPLTQEQLTYAADDAYAGYMLYYCMNAKRLAMTIVPTLPVHVDQYPGIKDRPGTMLGSGRSVWLRPERPGAAIYTAADFFRKAKGIPIQKRDENDVTPQEKIAGHGEKRKEPGHDDTQNDTKTSSGQTKSRDLGLSAFKNSKAELHDLLTAQRTRTAQSEKVPGYCVATNAELDEIVSQRPTTKQQLLRLRGMGPRKVEKYGHLWLGITRKFVENDEKRMPLSQEEPPVTPKANVKRVGRSLEFKGPPPPPQMNTGLSFSMAESRITSDRNKQAQEDSSDDEPVFGPPIPTPSRENIKRRRYDVLPPESSPNGPAPGRLSPEKVEGRRQMAASPHAAMVPTMAAPSTPLKTPPKPEPALSKDTMIFEKKLTALSRMVTSKLPPGQRLEGNPPLISEATIRKLALHPPGTAQELLHIHGVASFVRACANAKIDLMGNIAKWKPAASASST
ncbi:ribonuclease H-like protein [Apiospora kogelbergensis]|uniref:ribonuclease H-like protein n=1 Tax=Apiospora kogelbergensis TaxID=1337665 RepID=UPI003131182A